MDAEIKEILLEQLLLLKEASKKAYDPHELAELSREIVNMCELLITH